MTKRTVVKKAVIPVAGLGTRFLPATKSIPKEMLPVVDRPGILYIVEEAIAAGIETVVFVTGRHKTSLEEFFDHNYELEDILAKQGRHELLSMVQKISESVNVVSVRQKTPLGLGHAVYCARQAIGNEPFAVLLGDEVMVGSPTVTSQLAQIYSETGQSVCGVMEVPQSDVVKYGIVNVSPYQNLKDTYNVVDIVEKPSVEKAPSRWAIPGRYIFGSEIFEALAQTAPSKGGEIQLTDAMAKLVKGKGLLAHAFSGERYDTGDKAGFIKANIQFALRHPEIGGEIREFLKNLKVGK